jgi:hypothetical protein
MTAHLKAQALRFGRVSGYAFVVALMATGGHVTWATLWSIAAGAAEAGLRQLMPVEPETFVSLHRATVTPGPPS